MRVFACGGPKTVAHLVTVTGRIRHRRGAVEREYRCVCGHVGWSNHAVLEVGTTFEPDARPDRDEPRLKPPDERRNRCSTCGSKEHIATHCPQFCIYCGRRDHIGARCIERFKHRRC